MKAKWKRMMVAVAVLALTAQEASAQAPGGVAAGKPVLLGTTGACNNEFPGGPCTQTSTLVQLDPQTGALVRTIGPVGFTVNGLAWDKKNNKLYASTAIGCGVVDNSTTPPTPSVCPFHGLITINHSTGAGKPVDPTVHNFGLAGADSPIHSIAIDPSGQMVGWYDEFAPPGAPPVTDTFVTINKRTGVATEFSDTGIDTFQNGLAFQDFGPISILWNIDAPHPDPSTGAVTQNAYVLNPLNGKPFTSRPISPPTMAALGDFHPLNHLYYGLKFVAFNPTAPTSIIVVDPTTGTATKLADTVQGLHVLAFVKP